MTGKHILACDERGTIHLTGRHRTFTLGGFAAKETSRQLLADKWNEIKGKLCGSDCVELKWSHFFPGRHQGTNTNPLIVKDPQTMRKHALWALEEIFQTTHIFPITTIVQKDRVSNGLLTVSSSGRKILDVNQIVATLLGQFILYLQENNADEGEIWFDRLGSKKEEERRTAQFLSFFHDIILSAQFAKNRIQINKVNPNIVCKNSADEPFIQLADFLSGVIWAASEKDEWFIKQLLSHYAPGRRKTYGILILEG